MSAVGMLRLQRPSIVLSLLCSSLFDILHE